MSLNLSKYAARDFVLAAVSQETYASWLHKKASAHVRRDRRRWQAELIVSGYKEAIHKAVCTGDGRDPYTGEPLAWKLIGKYRNEEAKGAGSAYKRRFRLLPSVDHLDLKPRKHPRFQICSWELNDAKSDLSHDAFLDLCRIIAERFPVS